MTSTFYRSYRDSAEDDILVVLLNETSIDNLYPSFLVANEWPLTYIDHANLLSTIGRYKAKAVFVDIMFYRERSTDDSLNRALNKLKLRFGNANNKTPIYFAQGGIDTPMSEGMQKNLKTVGNLVR